MALYHPALAGVKLGGSRAHEPRYTRAPVVAPMATSIERGRSSLVPLALLSLSPALASGTRVDSGTFGLPAQAAVDALHIAIAACNGTEYLLTWNSAHIANAEYRSRVERVCRRQGYEPPVLCTPDELMGEAAP
jgi:hypothetical protein